MSDRVHTIAMIAATLMAESHRSSPECVDAALRLYRQTERAVGDEYVTTSSPLPPRFTIDAEGSS